MKRNQKEFGALREKYGISTMLPFVSLLQVPFLITWFLSLRYVASVPDKYPNIKTDGLFWFQDLSQYDPYFILPLISACISFYNIQISTVNANTAGGNAIQRFTRYFKYFPFLTMPIAAFFPAGVSLYWICSASVHLVISTTARSPAFRKAVGVPEYLPGSILEKLHGTKKVEVVKTVFADVTPETKASDKTEKAVEKEKVSPVSEKKTQAAPSGSVTVLTNKPKKKSS